MTLIEMNTAILIMSLLAQSPDASAPFDQREIFAVIKRSQREIRECYRSAEPLPSGMSSKLVTSWTIEADGSVSHITIERSTDEATALDLCIRKTIRRWKFPKPDGGGSVRVSFPWNFVPSAK